MSQLGRGGHGSGAGQGGEPGRHTPMDPGNVYSQDGFTFDSIIRMRRLRDFLETPGRFSIPCRTTHGVIQDHLISLFRLLIHYKPFHNHGELFWQTVAQDFGYYMYDLKIIVRIYVAARRAFLDSNNHPKNVWYPDRESEVLAALVDEYISGRDLQNQQSVHGLTESGRRYLEALRDAWRNYSPQDLLVREPTLAPVLQGQGAPVIPAAQAGLSTEGGDAMNLDEDGGSATPAATVQQEPFFNALSLRQLRSHTLAPQAPVQVSDDKPELREVLSDAATFLAAFHNEMQETLREPMDEYARCVRDQFQQMQPGLMELSDLCSSLSKRV